MAQGKKSFEAKLSQLAKRYVEGRKHYEATSYNETAVRNEFLNPLLKELGWDVENEQGRLPNDLEVMVETGDCEGRPDYNVRIDRKTVFYFEAKAPHVPVSKPDVIHQAKKYAWSDTVNTVPVSVVSNFEGIRVYDASFEPSFDFPELGELFTLHVDEYLEPKNIELLWLLSKENLSSHDGLSRLLKLCRDRGKSTSEKFQKRPDERLLEILGEYRERLAKAFYSANPKNLDEKSLTDIVGTLINRFLFIRVLEDRETIERRTMKDVVDHWKDYQDRKRGLLTKGLSELFEFINENFNGKLFEKDPNFERLKVPEDEVAEVISHLYGKNCPFQFNLLDVNTLGHIYEQFLAERIVLKGKGVQIEEKPEVKRAGGVYYTPHEIVDFIVAQTMRPVLEGRDVEELPGVTALDLSCGSGTFLLGVYDHLMKYALDYLLKHPRHKLATDWLVRDGEKARLSFKAKHKILMSCVYGSDIDGEAVKVSVLSLCLKALEDEVSIKHGKRLLPTLRDNIICSDSILEAENPEAQAQAKFPTEHFPKMVGKAGFDVVVGNPPYLTEARNNADLFRALRASESVRPWYEKNCDFFNFFILKGMQFLKPNGRLGYIVPQYLSTRTGCSIPRSEMLKHGRIDFYVDFGKFTVFDTAKGHHSCIFVYQNGASVVRDITGTAIDDGVVSQIQQQAEKEAARTVDPDNKKLFKNHFRERELDLVAHYLAEHADDACVFTLIGDKYSINSPAIGGGVDAIVTKGIGQLLNPDDICKGVECSPDKAKGDDGVTRGVFVLSNDEAKKFREAASDEEKALLKDFFWPSEIATYSGPVGPSKEKLFYIPTAVLQDIESKNAYSRLRKHLKAFVSYITSDNKPYGLNRARQERFFAGTHRLISPRKTQSPCFGYTSKDAYVDGGCNSLVFQNQRDALSAMSIFNSAVAHTFFYSMKRQGTQLQIDKEVIEAFKVPKNYDEPVGIEVNNASGLGTKSFESWKDFFASAGELLVKEMKDGKNVSAVNIQRLRALVDVAMCELFGLSEKEFQNMIELVSELQGDDWRIDPAVRKWAKAAISIDSSRKKLGRKAV